MKKSYPVDKFVVKQKFKAMGLHFLCSVLIFAVAVWWVMSVLYPSFYFQLSGGRYGLTLMASVDLILGPLLTLLVYHPMKPMREKILDFVVIALVQIAALGYGLYALYQEHPRMLMYHTYGNAVVVTQYNWDTHRDQLPKDVNQFSQIQGLPVAVYKPKVENNQAIVEYSRLNVADFELGNREIRSKMSHLEDKQHLAMLDKQYREVYVMQILGKYQAAFVALDKDMKMIDVFGQRDLQ